MYLLTMLIVIKATAVTVKVHDLVLHSLLLLKAVNFPEGTQVDTLEAGLELGCVLARIPNLPSLRIAVHHNSGGIIPLGWLAGPATLPPDLLHGLVTVLADLDVIHVGHGIQDLLATGRAVPINSTH